jgi:transcriptional regulator with XRE-family HTH domain
MNPSKSQSRQAPNELGLLLRQWRDTRGKSQLELSFDTGVSQRHLSFIESGRSAPSRQTLLDIAQALDVPLRERNVLLLAAGYAPIYAEGAWDNEQMQSVTKALQRMLRQHEPFPAVVMDRYWNSLMPNDALSRFFNHFIDLAAWKGPRNILHLMFDPQGMRPFMAGWENTAQSLIQRVYRESIGRVVDEKTRQLLASLLAYPGVDPAWKNPKVTSIAPTMPVIPLSFIHNDKALNYFSMISTVGTPQSVAAQELRIECLFPADDATEQLHLELMGKDPPVTLS